MILYTCVYNLLCWKYLKGNVSPLGISASTYPSYQLWNHSAKCRFGNCPAFWERSLVTTSMWQHLGWFLQSTVARGGRGLGHQGLVMSCVFLVIHWYAYIFECSTSVHFDGSWFIVRNGTWTRSEFIFYMNRTCGRSLWIGSPASSSISLSNW